jgi:hypothetical protein
MDWLLLCGLGIIWAASIVPQARRRSSTVASVEEFERNMGLLAETEYATGRWIIAPRKGERFVGRRERARTRARIRRRRIFTVLLESIALTLLIGLFPPLRRMWIGTGALTVLLGAYCYLLIKVKQAERQRARVTAPAEAQREPVLDLRPYEAPTAAPKGRVWSEDGGPVHVIVRPARELQTARA